MIEAVGDQVIVAVLLIVIPLIFVIILGLVLFNQRFPGTLTQIRHKIQEFYQDQFRDHDVPIEEPRDREQVRLQRRDYTCSICLMQPKRFEVSSTCGHSFCGLCIFQLYDRGMARKMKCPLCRQDMNMLFKCFHEAAPQRQAEGDQITQKIREYNLRFDDNRSFIRRIKEIPYTLKHLVRYMFSLNFLIFFLRSIRFLRLVFFLLFYLMSPFDILPESLVGIIGYIDDFLVIIILSTYVLSLVLIQFYRGRN